MARVTLRLYLETDNVDELERLAYQHDVGNISSEDVLDYIKTAIDDGRIILIGIHVSYCG